MRISNPFLKFNFVKSVAVRNAFAEIRKDQSLKRSWTDKIINIILFKPTLSENDKYKVRLLSNSNFTLIKLNADGDVVKETKNKNVKLNQIADIFHRLIKINKNEANKDAKTNQSSDGNEATINITIVTDDNQSSCSNDTIQEALEQHYNAVSKGKDCRYVIDELTDKHGQTEPLEDDCI